jgi:ribonuclease HII
VRGARDSKHLDRATRERLAQRILASGAQVALGAASVREIDRLNILRATTLAMRRALARLPEPPEHVVVDGRPVKGLGWEHDAVVGGDDLVHSISCASIVAKVVRDDLMRRLALRYPHFSWETNAGYGTAAHRSALLERGPTPHHRRSFMPLQAELDL